MSYIVSMDAEGVEAKIPLADIEWLTKKFFYVNFQDADGDGEHKVEIAQEWEEDQPKITGKLVNGYIVLDEEQSGSFKNSHDGGLTTILEKYKGSGILTFDGEEAGDHTVEKYEKGVVKKGKVVFD